MEETGNKKFYLITGAVAAIWTVSLLILSPAASGIKKERAEIDNAIKGIDGLYEEEHPPQGEYLNEVERQKRMLEQKLGDLAQKLDYPKQERFKENNSAFFSHHCKLRLEKLDRRAKQLGVKIGSPIFPRSPSDTILRERPSYWTALEAGSKIASLLLEINSDTGRLYSISKIHYPRIQKSTRAPFIREFPVNVTFESDFAFAVKVLKQCSCQSTTVFRYLFSIKGEEQSLDKYRISDELRKKFDGDNERLSKECTVKVLMPGSKWLLCEEKKQRRYEIVKETHALNVYRKTALAFLEVKDMEIKRNLAKREGAVMVKITLVVFFVNLQGRLEDDHSALMPAGEVDWGKDWKADWDRH